MHDDAWSKLTWAALLARWVEFARSSVALPSDAEGMRLRASVPDLIMLQAVWHALSELDELTVDERKLGLDRAQVLIDRHATAIHSRWAGQPLPAVVVELIDDARERLRATAARFGADEE